MDIVNALDSQSGVVCTVGAGGKKTTLYTLAERTVNGGDDGCPVVTATIRIPIFDSRVEHVVVTENPGSAVKHNADVSDSVGVVLERERADHYRGYGPTAVDELADARGADPVLVKADGARACLFKAPSDREPQIPEGADTVIPVASARVVGKPPLGRARSQTWTNRGDHRTSNRGEGSCQNVARVFANERGGLKGIPEGATVVPLVNMVDDESLRATGEEIADGVLERTDGILYVVLAQMTADDPLVSVVE